MKITKIVTFLTACSLSASLAISSNLTYGDYDVTCGGLPIDSEEIGCEDLFHEEGLNFDVPCPTPPEEEEIDWELLWKEKYAQEQCISLQNRQDITSSEIDFLSSIKCFDLFPNKRFVNLGYAERVDLKALFDTFAYLGHRIRVDCFLDVYSTYGKCHSLIEVFKCSCYITPTEPDTYDDVSYNIIHKKYEGMTRTEYTLGPFDGVQPELRYQRSDKRRFAQDGFKITQNDHGEIVLHNGTLITILDDAIYPGEHILEIGSAEGHQTYKMIKMGAHVCAVEKSKTMSLGAKVMLERLHLDHMHTPICAHFPSDPNLSALPEKHFDIVLMSHVAHYLTGEELRQGFHHIKRWLKPGGRLYFQTLTPYSAPYITIAQEARQKAKKGERWPGFSPNAYIRSMGMPKQGHPLFPATLERELQDAGFHISSIDYCTVQKTEEHAEPRHLSLDYKDVDKILDAISEKRMTLENAVQLCVAKASHEERYFLRDVLTSSHRRYNMVRFLESTQKSFEHTLTLEEKKKILVQKKADYDAANKRLEDMRRVAPYTYLFKPEYDLAYLDKQKTEKAYVILQNHIHRGSFMYINTVMAIAFVPEDGKIEDAET